MLNKFIIVLALGVLLSPVLSMAANMPNIWPTGFWAPNGLVSCLGASTGGSAGRQCTDLNDLFQTILNVISFGMTIALFVVSPILLAWSGLMILTSGGSTERVGSGKKILTGTIVGIVMVLGSYLIVQMFVSFLGIAGIGGFS